MRCLPNLTAREVLRSFRLTDDFFCEVVFFRFCLEEGDLPNTIGGPSRGARKVERTNMHERSLDTFVLLNLFRPIRTATMETQSTQRLAPRKKRAEKTYNFFSIFALAS